MRITVHAKPGSREPCITESEPAVFTVAVREPPIGGKANRAIIAALADHFNVSASQVRIVLGHASRHKVVDINNGSD